MSYPTTGSQETQMIKPCQKFQGHFGRVYDVVHLPGAQLMTCSSDGSLRLWNSESGEQIGDDWRDRRFDVMETIALSPDGKKVVSGSGEGGMRLWDLDSGKLMTKWMGHTKRVTSVCWNRDSGRLLSGSLDRTARVWDAESGETVLGPIETGLFAMFVAIYSPDETMIGTGGREFEGNELEDSASIKVWDAEAGTLISELKGRIGAVYCLAWTASGTLISGSEDGSIRTWNTTTWQQIAVLAKHNDVVFDITIFPNGRILASASLDKTARLWNLENGQPIGVPLRHADVVECVSFSVDGRLIATGCRDKNAYTWDVYAIVREAGLEALLTVGYNKSFLDGDATGQKLEDSHESFFDYQDHADAYHYHPASPARQRNAAWILLLRGHSRFSSLFRQTHSQHSSYDMLPRPHPLHWARHIFSLGPNGGMVLQEHRPTVVDVPFVKGKRRNIAAAEVRLKKDKERNVKKVFATSSRPPQNGAMQQSSGTSPAQPSSHAVVSTPSVATAVIVATSAATALATSRPDIMITRAGCWTRFWLFICCASAQYTDGH